MEGMLKSNLERDKLPVKNVVQDKNCLGYASKNISKCRECIRNMTRDEREKTSPTNNCRFSHFRRIQFTRNKTRSLAGFNDPFIHPKERDKQIWLQGGQLIKRETYAEETQKDENVWNKSEFDVELAHQIISQVGDQFCDLCEQEMDVINRYLARGGNKAKEQKVLWKRVVKGVREMCDMCATTLFNFHWTCGKCGFAVCIDCVNERKIRVVLNSQDELKERDKYAWLLCFHQRAHDPDYLSLTQIIPADCFEQINMRLHECRSEWGIVNYCKCDYKSRLSCNENLKSLIKGDLTSVINAQLETKQEKQIKEESSRDNAGETQTGEISQTQSAMEVSNESHTDSDSDDIGGPSSLRQYLNVQNPVNSDSACAPGPSKRTKKSKMDTLDEVMSTVIKDLVKKEEQTSTVVIKPCILKYFVRRYKRPQRGREPLPIRIMTLTESKCLYPEVPHSWLCDGKLLRLHDSNNSMNYRIFQDQWKRGQPVLVSDMHKYLDQHLWRPESFSRDFGYLKADLINCMTGKIVPKQPMSKFWDGFEHVKKRLRDDRGRPMLLKLKDWPPRGDFADILPSRFADLMKCIPLSEYTHRFGRLNLPSRLPATFVRPDLGPKMYIAYGSSIHPDKGTTNLHLDVSDAVNVMVYVGIINDSDREKRVKAALKAIDEAGCDILTRRRVRQAQQVPGALWHIYAARDADKIRDMLNAVAIERGDTLEPYSDAIHDQSFYLDGPLRERLYRDYGVEGYAIVQCLGDAVFVPAGAPHQVRNLHNCIKVAEDFVSPENISHCFHLMQEFRALSEDHMNHEDKLQVKNIIYHAVKDSLTALSKAKSEVLAKAKDCF
ncbi:lysine-specific demethylase 3A-like isoform X2 [Phymastichus coffea]|uniref:lysine-specific demethylase 3A-like isoform X2 n=1 Tax=Phymastichus coffea TaxID=108790 RepID=UPI00273CB3A9|nr:lysine-specific demethylase 3A-like isoform X2 [Phymastichus coffea]